MAKAATQQVQATPEPSLDSIAVARAAMRDMAFDLALQAAVIRCSLANESKGIIDALLLLREEHGYDNSMFRPKAGGAQNPE
jgi:hypothetical protein